MRSLHTISSSEALSRLQNICSGQEKCSSDIRTRLRQWKISPEDQEKILNRLIKDGFVDDRRFTGFFVRDKQRLNKWGKEKIRFALQRKELSREIIDEALLLIPDENFEETLRELLRRKSAETTKYNPYELKNKLIRFAVQRGFQYDLIFRVVDEFISSEGSDENTEKDELDFS